MHPIDADKDRAALVSDTKHSPIYKEQVKLLYGQLRLGALASLINSAILCLMLWQVQSVQTLGSWYLAVLLVNLPRIFMPNWFQAEADAGARLDHWVRLFIASNIASGAAWGIGAYVLFPQESIPHQVFIAFILAGMTAGAATLYSALRLAYAAFILPALLPFALRLILPGHELQVYMGLLVLFYAVVLLVSSKRINSTIMDSLRLRFSNDQLLETLTSARHQLEESNQALHSQLTKLEIAEQSAQKSNTMLNAISRAQMRFIQHPNLNELFDELLASLLRLTGSEYGFIGQVLREPDGAPYLKTYAITNIAWNEETRLFYEVNAPQGMEFHNRETLFGRVMTTGKPLISNDPQHDPRSGGLPKGHPALRAFLGVPFFHGGEMIGVIGIANRPGGYVESMVEELAPFLNTCASIIHGERVSVGRAVAESRLERTAAELRAIHAQIADGIATLNFDGQFITVNPAVERMFGAADNDLRSMPLEQLVKHQDRESWRNLLRKFIAGDRRSTRIEVQGLRADLVTEFPLEIMLSHLRLRDDDRVIAVLRDVTERKRIEKLKSEFIATVSHELRTPLTSIRGSLGLLQGGMSGELPEQAAHLLDIALNNSERLGVLIDDLLDMEKIESGGMSFKIGRINVRELLEDVMKANTGYAARLHVKLRSDEIAADLSLLGDYDRLVQVLNNLISNAVKFSPPQAEVVLAARAMSTDVRIEVRDAGCGIPEEFQEKVFDKFTQADASDSRAVGGTGLGLSISKAILERMQGRIGFDSVPGQGTTFYFDLPAA